MNLDQGPVFPKSQVPHQHCTAVGLLGRPTARPSVKGPVQCLALSSALSPASSGPFFPNFSYSSFLTFPPCLGMKCPCFMLNPPLQQNSLPGLAVHDVIVLDSLISSYFFSLYTPLNLAKFIHIFLSPSLPANFARPLLCARYLLGTDAHGQYLPFESLPVARERPCGP